MKLTEELLSGIIEEEIYIKLIEEQIGRPLTEEERTDLIEEGLDLKAWLKKHPRIKKALAVGAITTAGLLAALGNRGIDVSPGPAAPAVTAPAADADVGLKDGADLSHLSFSKAFRKSLDGGLDLFTWKGKSFGTALAKASAAKEAPTRSAATGPMDAREKAMQRWADAHAERQGLFAKRGGFEGGQTAPRPPTNYKLGDLLGPGKVGVREELEVAVREEVEKLFANRKS